MHGTIFRRLRAALVAHSVGARLTSVSASCVNYRYFYLSWMEC